MAASIQKQQGEIDALKDLLRDKVEGDSSIHWEIETPEINVCDLSPSQNLISKVLTSPITSAAASVFSYGAYKWFGKSTNVSAVGAVVAGAATYIAGNYLARRTIKRVLFYRISKTLIEQDHEMDERPSYDSSRALVAGDIYECTPFIRQYYSDGTEEDTNTLRYDDPDYIELTEKNLFEQRSWFTYAPKPQVISASMTRKC